MAVSKKAKQMEDIIKNNFVPATKLPADKLALVLKLAKDIGSGKKNGFIFVSEIKDNPFSKSTHLEGVAYMQRVSQLDVAEAILTSGSVSREAFIEAIKINILRGVDTTFHEHDEDGNCIK